jgi:hypothetical protein
MYRLYFSHSYDPEHLRFNEHLWKLLMSVGFHAWIDSGRDVVPGSNAGQSGARRPMDISFNEWMMSQCDGFVAIVPKRRKSTYQVLEYQTAIRMGVPRLVALEQGGTFNAFDSELVPYPTSWRLFWLDQTQSTLVTRIEEFAELVRSYKAMDEVIRTIGHWRTPQNSGQFKVALLPPRADDSDWQELQRALQESDEVSWTLLSPANISIERKLLDEKFDLLVVDVGPSGTPQEALGYIHALGIPQIRLCRVRDREEVQSLGRYLDATKGRKRRFVYEQYSPDALAQPALPRFLDGLQLDQQMQPVTFWATPSQAVDHIRDTTQLILTFRSGLPPEEGGITEAIDTRQSAKRYFDQYWQRAGRGFVFLSFAGQGGATKLADRLAQILRFHNLRCFHYRDKDSSSDGRLESGEDLIKGLELRINQADIVVYLIEENFIASEYCRSELAQGKKLFDQGMIEFRAYSLDSLKEFPPELGGTTMHKFRELNWTHSDVEQKIVADVEDSLKARSWVLHEEDRDTLAAWLKQDQRDSIEAVVSVLKSMGVPESDIRSVVDAAKADPNGWFNGLLRVPNERHKHKRARQIVALLLMAISRGMPERANQAVRWLYERHLLQWPPLVASQGEDQVVIKDFLVTDSDAEMERIKTVGQKLGQVQEYRALLLSGTRPLCVTAKSDFLAVPIEWARETQDDEPLAVRRPVRWRLPEAESRTAIFDDVAANAVPPTTLVLSLAGSDINSQEQMRRLNTLLRLRYETLGWPPELVSALECSSVSDVLVKLNCCQEQVVHIVGHMGDAGLKVGDELLPATELTTALRRSDVRLLILNGCEAAKPGSQMASAYLTLADRLIRDAGVNEVVAHRCKISEADALAFAEAFHFAFFNSNEGFDCARSAMSGRKAGSQLLRYSPVVLSQRASREAQVNSQQTK